MPLMETDVLYAYLNKADKSHDIAVEIFKKIGEGEIKSVPKISGLSLIELEILLKSGVVKIGGRTPTDEEISKYLGELCEGLRIYAVPIDPLHCETVKLSAEIRAKYKLSYYDSHYAAQAQLHDKVIVSSDNAYDKVAEIERIEPESLIQRTK